MSGYQRPELLATVGWLATNLDRPGIRVMDVRWRPDRGGSAAYALGHIPGATHLDWSTELAELDETSGARILAGPDAVARSLEWAGVGDGTTLVLYDDMASLHAARVWWSLRAYGFDSCRILDGGLQAWTAAGMALSNARPAPARASFVPRVQPRMRLGLDDVKRLLTSPDVQVLDARSPADFRGLQGNGGWFGSIPGALNVPVAAMTEPGTGAFRNGAALRSILSRASVMRGRRLVCYDGSGVAATKLAFVLTLLGHEDVAVYEGGWSEWSNRADVPV